MKLTLIEECILLAHRVNKLGGCVFVRMWGHTDNIDFEICTNKKDFKNKVLELEINKDNTKYDYKNYKYVDATDDLEHLKGTLEGMISDLKGDNK